MEHFPDISYISDVRCITKRKWDVPVVVELKLEQTLNGGEYPAEDAVTYGVDS